MESVVFLGLHRISRTVFLTIPLELLAQIRPVHSKLPDPYSHLLHLDSRVPEEYSYIVHPVRSHLIKP
uniref:Uncharacterized protein n=1 Tax=Bursaphelenchus xylophilus TaxID=6326 RepID=A0A1I7SBR6_BURXY